MIEARYNLNTVYERSLLAHIQIPYPALGIFAGFNPVGTVIATVKGAFNFNNEFNGEDFFPVEINGWEIPDEPLITVSGSNRIVETALNRGDRVANVIEQINLNSYQIRIKGTLYSDEEDVYPEELVTELKDLLETKGAVDISCPKLDYLGITRVAVKSVEMPEREGTPEEQDYTIYLTSDTPVELELLNEN